jgi:hypothetical protein
MKRSSLITLTMLILFTFLSTDIMAQKVTQPRSGNPGSWRVLGTCQAKSSADHDAIYLKGPYDYFRKLKFKVTDSNLEMGEMLVRYDDGGAPERIEVRQNIEKGGESRVIDLKGGKRKLKSVEFWYKDRGFMNGKADLTLFGMK